MIGGKKMEWFNGTFKYTDEKLAAEYPVVAAHGLRFSADGKQMAIVNDFPEGTREIDLSDPKVGAVDGATFVFYHVFSGEDAAAAKQAIEVFLPVMDAADNNSVKLLRREPDRLFQYADGHICLGLLREQDTLREKLLPDAAEDVFILPLKRFMHKCPVCGRRTLAYRDYFLICDECGWEDEGIDGDDEEPYFAPNGDYTIRQYRKKYLEKKAADPDYSWKREFDERMAQL